MSDNKKKLTMIGLSIFALAIVTLGTYALWSQISTTRENTISTGQVKMSYTEVNELTLNNALPMKDEDGKKQTNYFDFKVLSYIKTNANDNTKRKLNYNVILEPLTVTNALSNNEVKVYLTKIENGVETEVITPTTIDKLNNYILKSQEETFSNNKGQVTTSYRIRTWIDYNVNPDKFNNKSYSYKFRVNVNNEDAPKVDYALDFAKSKVGTDGLEQITHTIDNTLQVDNKFATEYRYRGGDSVVKNYVTFNNETWRIIGIIPTEDTDGNVENRFKIIRDESIGNMYWNNCGTSDNVKCDDSNKYLNNWTGSTLNTYLNNDYYNSFSNDTKNMIGTTKYYLGGYNSSEMTSNTMWQYERKKTNGSNCLDGIGTECYYFYGNPIMQSDANKKIALMYASDYGYAASKKCTSNLIDYVDYASCITTNNWLDKSANTHLLSNQPVSYDSTFGVSDEGYVSAGFGVDREYGVHPVLTLSSNVKISGGEGTSSNPYTLSID